MIKIIDVGSAPVPGVPECYAPLVKDGAEVVGFDARDGRVIGDGYGHFLYVTKDPNQTSLFEPDFDVLDRFVDLSSMFEVVKTDWVETERLDDTAWCWGADFLKMDVQGAECIVLAGATETLKSVLVVQAEITYVPFYKGQAMLGDVDTMLRAAGFYPHLSPGIGQRHMTGVPESPEGSGLQFLYGDWVYLRDFTKCAEWTPEQRRKAAEILFTCYDSQEMAAWLMRGAQ